MELEVVFVFISLTHFLQIFFLFHFFFFSCSIFFCLFGVELESYGNSNFPEIRAQKPEKVKIAHVAGIIKSLGE